ncbi:MAG: hypothetical protein WCL07_00750 [bacterium]
MPEISIQSVAHAEALKPTLDKFKFKRRIEFDSKLDNKSSLIDRLSEQVKLYNSGSENTQKQTPEKYFLQIIEDENPTAKKPDKSTFKMRVFDKQALQQDSNSRPKVELVFAGTSKPTIAFDDYDSATDVLTNLRGELDRYFFVKDFDNAEGKHYADMGFGALRSLVGQDALAALEKSIKDWKKDSAIPTLVPEPTPVKKDGITPTPQELVNEAIKQQGEKNKLADLLPSLTPIVPSQPAEIVRVEPETPAAIVHVEPIEIVHVDPEPISVAKPLTEIKTTVVGAKGQVERTGSANGKDILEQELVLTNAELFAQRQLDAKPPEWDPKAIEQMPFWEKFGIRAKNILNRGWRSTFSEPLHFEKERKHALELMASAGTSDITQDALDIVDTEARKRGEAKRQSGNWFEKRIFASKKLFTEMFGMQGQLHADRVAVMKEMRASFDADPLNLDNAVTRLFLSDVAAREAVASRFGGEYAQETLHVGEKRSAESIKVNKESELGAPVFKFLNEEIFSTVAKDTLRRVDAGETNIKDVDPKLRLDLDRKLQNYFMTEDFTKWRTSSELTVEQQLAINDSLTYSTDIIKQAESLLVPNVQECQDYYRSVEKLDLNIEMTLGTAKFGPNGEIPSSFLFGENKVHLNAEVWDKIRARAQANLASNPFDSQDIARGVGRSGLLLAATVVTTSAPTMAMAALVGSKMAVGVTKGLSAAAAPLTVGIFTGIKSGITEYAMINRQVVERDMTEALGLTRPQSEAAKRNIELAKRDHTRIKMTDRIGSLTELTTKLAGEAPELATVFTLLAQTADSYARQEVGDSYGINLLSATRPMDGSAATLTSYQQEVMLHDKSRAVAKTALTTYFGNNPTTFRELATKLGVSTTAPTGANSKDVELLFQSVVQTQREQLIDSSTLSTEYQAILGCVSVKEAETITESKALLSKWRTGQAIKSGLITGGISGLSVFGMQYWNEHHSEIVGKAVDSIKQKIESVAPADTIKIPGLASIKDTAGVEHPFNAIVPKGTHLMNNPDGSYDLLGADNKQMLQGIMLNKDGSITNITELHNQGLANGLKFGFDNAHEPTIQTGTITADGGHWETTAITDKISLKPGTKDGGLWQIISESRPNTRPPVLSLVKNFGRGMDKDGLVDWSRESGQAVHATTTAFGTEHFVGGQALDSVAKVPANYLTSIDSVNKLYSIAEAYVDNKTIPLATSLPKEAQDYLANGHTMDQLMLDLKGWVSSGRGSEKDVMDAYNLYKDMFLNAKTWVPEPGGTTTVDTDMMTPIITMFQEKIIEVPITPIIPPIIPIIPIVSEWHRALETNGNSEVPSTAVVDTVPTASDDHGQEDTPPKAPPTIPPVVLPIVPPVTPKTPITEVTPAPIVRVEPAPIVPAPEPAPEAIVPAPEPEVTPNASETTVPVVEQEMTDDEAREILTQIMTARGFSDNAKDRIYGDGSNFRDLEQSIGMILAQTSVHIPGFVYDPAISAKRNLKALNDALAASEQKDEEEVELSNTRATLKSMRQDMESTVGGKFKEPLPSLSSILR